MTSRRCGAAAVASSRTARRELLAEGQQEDVPRRHGVDPVAAGPRRPPGGGRLDRSSPQDQAAGRQVQGHGPGLGDGHRRQIDDNLALASRNLANVLVVEPRYADPLSLVFYKKVLVTKGAIEQLKEMFA
jgi:hypothetical protein